MTTNEEPKDLGKDRTTKLLEKIKAKKSTFKDVWGVQKLLNEKDKKKEMVINNTLFSFNPYYSTDSPSILTLHHTSKAVYVLLKNGKVFKFSRENKKQAIENVYTNKIPMKLNSTRKLWICPAESSMF